MGDMAQTIMIIVGVIVIIALILAYPFLLYNSVSTVTGTVSEKWIKSVGEDSQKYLISVNTENGTEVLENVDSMWLLKFNSSDVYAQIKPEKEYTFKVAGWRIPFLSWYKNILEVTEVVK